MTKMADPVDAILDQMGWSQADIATLTGYSDPRISEFLNRKRKLPLAFIRNYHKVDPATPLHLLIQDYKL